MKGSIAIVAACAALFAFVHLSQAASGKRYIATSRTAMAITGDVTVSDNAIVFGNGKSLVVRRIAADRPGHWGMLEPGVTKADVYELKQPQDPVLLNGNTLCGAGPVRYLAVRPGKGDFMELVVFNPKADPFGNGRDRVCATYNFGG